MVNGRCLKMFANSSSGTYINSGIIVEHVPVTIAQH
ncbi:hypothetical protein T4A_8769 [Trichinella pseudospiralis]|uniref:Uncharacterized protein n=1 Tax=Trichinella pseudospiralis TaxID=6337 RepID=A0A0V1JIW0_TRIPS|nr:hypothetical protein T4A_8769 [Trichinella pseudospiralis]KRZ34879.1 hypothetical protein T4C_6758 [Trichinella pseudospiralis]